MIKVNETYISILRYLKENNDYGNLSKLISIIECRSKFY